ncbi:MAG: hypothetical protein ACKO3N_07295, partial [Verrucomicrobiota bacterium]
ACWRNLLRMPGVFRLLGGLVGLVLGAGAARAQTPGEPDLRVTREPGGLRVEVALDGATPAVVWEASESLGAGGWAIVRVDRPVQRTAEIRLADTDSQRFLRVRALASPGFNGRVDRIVGEVRAQWPGAALLEASSILPTLVETYPDSIALRVVFHVEGGSVVVNETDWTAPVVPEFTALPWLGSARLPWPVALDELEAEAIFRAQAPATSFGAVTLRQPVFPGMTEPYFIFRTPGGPFVFVGTITRQVKRE